MITCHVNTDGKTLDLVENGEMVGRVSYNVFTEDVEIYLNHRKPTLTFNEIAIIQDCWSNMIESSLQYETLENR